MGWGSGPGKGDQNFQNMPSLWRHLQKTPTENEKLFFSMSTRRLAESVKGLNSSLALAASNLWPKKGQPIAVLKGLRGLYLDITNLNCKLHLCNSQKTTHYDCKIKLSIWKCNVIEFDCTNVYVHLLIIISQLC